MDDIATPYDQDLFSLNDQLNKTYIAYGSAGRSNLLKQEEVDQMNYSMNKSVAAKRVAVKGKKSLYKNNNWDLVDAFEQDSLFVARVYMKTLPDSLQKKSRTELKAVIKEKNNQRSTIQKQIEDLSTKREVYIVKERAKLTKDKNPTLESAIEQIIRKQASRFNMQIQ